MDSYRTAVMEGVSCWLRPVDVGALIERPRAIDNRPYRFYRHILEFFNTPSSWVHVRCGHKKSRYPKGYLDFFGAGNRTRLHYGVAAVETGGK